MKILLCLLMILGTAISYGSTQFKNASDGEYITVSGKVTKASGKNFHLESKGQKMEVTMNNNFDMWTSDGLKIRQGDKIVVTGRVDNDLLDKKTLNASSVYVKNLNSYFYGDSSDNSYTPVLSSSYMAIEDLPENSSVDITGKVTNISGREFTVDTGLRKVQVDTADMLYNPMDSTGLTQVKKGDRVQISGLVDNKYLDEKELSASYIIELDNEGSSTFSE